MWVGKHLWEMSYDFIEKMYFLLQCELSLNAGKDLSNLFPNPEVKITMEVKNFKKYVSFPINKLKHATDLAEQVVRKWESSYRECETHAGRQNSEIEEDTKIIWSTY